MLKLFLRHAATGITVDMEAVAVRTRNAIAIDLRDATMALIDKVAVEKHMPVVEAMQNSQVEIIAKWEPNENA